MQLPDTFDELSLYCRILPLSANSPAFPFSGVVVNLCVSTTAHRDQNDRRICVVIPFGEWEGGDLCLHELGLVIKLHPGDIVVFPSRKITHFNLHFTGMLRDIFVFPSPTSICISQVREALLSSILTDRAHTGLRIAMDGSGTSCDESKRHSDMKFCRSCYSVASNDDNSFPPLIHHTTDKR